MSSGFVSGGTTDKPVERDDEWLEAQQEIEATRRRKEEESRQQGGKTLYDVLQENKASKQEAFEESIRLKNQFRTLDEDEIEFLDSVLESTRAKEEAVKKETTEQLDLFRQQQEEADKALLSEAGASIGAGGPGSAGSPPAEESPWALNARKRKRTKDKEGGKGIKLRKSSSTSESVPSLEKDTQSAVSTKSNTIQIPGPAMMRQPVKDDGSTMVPASVGVAPVPASKSSFSTARTLSLVGYDSDDEDSN